jgi:PilZ domain-containing protein
MHTGWTQPAANSPPTPTKRPYRHSICTLAYVRIDHANGGIIRNLSDTGMALQAVARLHAEEVVHLRFELIRPRAKFELVGQVTWADAKGQAGVRFTDVSKNSRRLLKEWILTDLLTATLELNGRRPVLKGGSAEDGLVMSSLPFQPIRLAAAAPIHVDGPASSGSDRVSIPWWPTGIRKTSLARFVDTAVVISAVLLFSIIVAELTDIVPSWLVLACTIVVLVVVFALLYAWLCHFIMRGTLGGRLAQLALAKISDKMGSPACDPY